jgi:DNA repair protein RadC
MKVNTYRTKLVKEGVVEYKVETLNSTDAACRVCVDLFTTLLGDAVQEEFWVVTLNTKNKVVGLHQITVGTIDSSLVHPREVFRAALLDGAAHIMLVHNHPSGDTKPSAADVSVTKRLVECGELMGVKVLDHVVVGWPEGAWEGTATSLRAEGLM